MQTKTKVAYALVVHDMQHGFPASRGERVQANVLNRIEQARAAHLPIIVLQMAPRTVTEINSGESWVEDYGTTYQFILDALSGYELWVLCSKERSSGAEEVRQALEAMGLDPECLQLCGVNSDECVIVTGYELSLAYPQARIQLIKKACATDNEEPLGQWHSVGTVASLCGLRDYELV